MSAEADRVRPGDPVPIRWSASRATGMGSTAFVGGLVFGLAGWLTGRSELLAVGLTATAAVLLALVLCPRPGRLTVAVGPVVRTAAGTEFVDEVRITRAGKGAGPVLVVSLRSTLADTVSQALRPIPPGGARVVRLPRSATTRGVEPGRAVRLAVRDPFGLTRRIGTAVVAGELIVRPAPVPVDLPAPIGGTEQPDEVPAELRPWRPGDDRRRISWRATARTGAPVVAVPDRVADGPVVVLPTACPGDRAEDREAAVARVAAAAVAYARTRPVSLGDGPPTRDPEALADRAARVSRFLDAAHVPEDPVLRYAGTPHAQRVLAGRGLGDRVVTGGVPGPPRTTVPPGVTVGGATRAALWALTAAGLLIGAASQAVPATVALLLVAVAAATSYAAARGWSRDPHRPQDALLLLAVLAVGAFLAVLTGLAGDIGVLLVLILATAFPLWTPRARSERLALLVAALPALVGTGLGEGLPDGSRPLLALAVAALLAALALGERDRLRAAGLPEGVPTGVLRPLPLLAAAALLLVPLLRPDATTVHSLAGGTGVPGAGSSAPTTSRADSLAGLVDLSARGELPTTPVWAVPADSPGLWRSAVLDAYDGRTWTNAGPFEPGRVESGDLRLVPPQDPVHPAGARVVAEVQALTDNPGSAIAPGVAERVQTMAGAVVPLQDSAFAVAADRPAYRVTATAVPTLASVGSRGAGPDSGDPRWRALPPIPARVTDLAATLAAQNPDRVAYARAVEEYVRTHIAYDLDSPVPADGADAVDDVLFVSHRGFCEQFAAAEVVLLRAEGISARLVVGFAGGEAGPGGTRVLRGSDAHAWVELWVPGTGWVSSDPTAGSATYDPPFPTLQVGLVALGVLLVAAIGVVEWRRRRRPGIVDPDPLHRAFADLERAAAAAGHPRTPDETLARFAERYADDRDARWALGVVESQLYGAVRPRPDLQERAAAILRSRAAGAVPEPASERGRAPAPV